MIGVSFVSFGDVDAEMLALCVRGLARQDVDLMVAVWTNADPTGRAAADYRRTFAGASFTGSVTVVTRGDNIGYAGGHNRNLGYLFKAGCTGVLVTNNDLVLEPDAVARMRRTADRYGGMCLVGPWLALGAREGLVPLNRVDTAGIHWTRAGRHFDVGHGKELPNIATSPYATAAVSGACIYVPAAAHSRIRGSTHEFFDECFLAYREDAELGIRAQLLGVEPVIEPGARGLHFRGNPGTARGSTLIDLLSVQNRFLLRWKYLFKGPWSPLMAGSRDLLVVVAVLLRERTSIDGIVGAWRIRRRMRWKGRRLRFAADL